MLGRRENVVTGTYCTDCVNMDNLAAIRNGSLDANGMRDGVHMRLTLTRGKKVTSGRQRPIGR